ncbi:MULTISPECIES: pilin [Aliivibrio]|uniref:pilin n=1 Tax=Aliivibrio TaxID=511678 RepID=UPI00080EAA91|nr:MULTISPECIES: pilin [Aliivibrio]MBD1568639.1 pilin [Aliivibrio sp. S10_S31]OCH02880.1 prepilin-type N-terminal cleavage/methylation domain-containing protein [Aliivibrio fischeri]OCH31369.1 prepilin-type N-terminal cleavage/methylation domain-containing protein [Aliivibrio fischeri]OED54983.1 prepilin-type N-terminal cleavage/methylation domain-containing protein [Aliivibrio fischeri]
MKKRQGQKGFTLIELMIVVAVIGVLSAIAMPQYQKYVAKAEVASALATLTGVKTNVEAYAVENGTFPDGSSTNQTEVDLGVPNSIPGGSIEFAAASTGSGTITFTFDSSGVSTLITGKKFQLARTGTDGSWACDGSATTPVTDDLLPKNCK